MTTAMTARDTALWARELGLSPMVPKEDGSKSPLAELIDGEWTWKPYQTTPATIEKIQSWFANGRKSVGLATGYSGEECFEFDCRVTYEAFLEAAIEIGLSELVDRVRTGYEEFTPGGGVHWLFYCDELRGSTKLAKRPDPTPEKPDNQKTLIETKGQGGFVIIAPSNGKVHPTGGAYVLVSGGLDKIATITSAERELLSQLAQTFDEIEEESEAKPDPVRSGSSFRTKATGGAGFPKEGTSPGDDFEARVTWDDVLIGWTRLYTRGSLTYWRRPGKDIGGSATTGRRKGPSETLKVFTTSTSLKNGGTYSKFGAHAALNYHGNFTEAVKDLVAKGFGTWIDDDGKERQNPVPQEWFEKRKQAKQSASPDSDGEWNQHPLGAPPAKAGDFPITAFPAEIQKLITGLAETMTTSVDLVGGFTSRGRRVGNRPVRQHQPEQDLDGSAAALRRHGRPRWRQEIPALEVAGQTPLGYRPGPARDLQARTEAMGRSRTGRARPGRPVDALSFKTSPPKAWR